MSNKAGEQTPADETASSASSSSSYPFEGLLGKTLLTKVSGNNREQPTARLLKDAEWVGLFFASGSHAGSKRFTQYLLDFYKRAQKQNCKFQIVYVGSDETIQAFEEYFANLPWLAMSPTESTDLKNALSKRFLLTDIPHLIILNKNGEFVTNDALKSIFDLTVKVDSTGVVRLFQKWKQLVPLPLEQATVEIQKDKAASGQTMYTTVMAMLFPLIVFAVSYVLGLIFWSVTDEETPEGGDIPVERLLKTESPPGLDRGSYAADSEF